VRSFAFRYSCYSEFGWSPEIIASLPESEAWKLAIVFEETGAYTYKKNKEMEKQSSKPGGGPSEGFEEDFSFGGEDPNDYADRPDILYGIPIE
jgi:hypothetical protein